MCAAIIYLQQASACYFVQARHPTLLQELLRDLLHAAQQVLPGPSTSEKSGAAVDDDTLLATLASVLRAAAKVAECLLLVRADLLYAAVSPIAQLSPFS